MYLVNTILSACREHMLTWVGLTKSVWFGRSLQQSKSKPVELLINHKVPFHAVLFRSEIREIFPLFRGNKHNMLK